MSATVRTRWSSRSMGLRVQPQEVSALCVDVMDVPLVFFVCPKKLSVLRIHCPTALGSAQRQLCKSAPFCCRDAALLDVNAVAVGCVANFVSGKFFKGSQVDCFVV